MSFFQLRDIDFDPIKFMNETLSGVGYACEITFDPLAGALTFLSYFQIMFESLIHFEVVRKRNFDPSLIFNAIIDTKLEKSSFFE